MPAGTITATLLGVYRSKVTATPLSSALASVDILTIAHQLGTTPDEVRPVTRSIQGVASVGTPVLAFQSANGSQAILSLNPTSAGSTNGIFDVVCEYTYSPAR